MSEIDDHDKEFREELYDADKSAPPPWLHLLDPIYRGWREDQILKGRNPDPHIEEELRKEGLWPGNGPS